MKSIQRLFLAFALALALPSLSTHAADEGDSELKNAVQKTTDGQHEVSTTLAPKDQSKCHDQKEILEKPDYLGCKPSKSPLFSSDSILEITVRGYARDKLQNNKGRDLALTERRQQAPISIEYELNGAKQKLEAGSEKRGKSRRINCFFEPLRILLDPNQDRAGTLVDHLKGDDLKLTVHCNYFKGTIADHPEENEAVIKEYSIYQALKAAGYVTPNTRLAKITYLDTNGKFFTEGYGFFIEPKSDLAHRCKAKHLKPDAMAVNFTQMDKKNLVPLLLAERLAGSWDWIPELAHNTIPLTRDGKIIALAPYDFNDVNLVNARKFNQPQGVEALPPWQWQELILKGPYDRDGAATPISDAEKKSWKEAVLQEAKRVLSRKDSVMKAMEHAPIQDKDSFKEYFDKYFKTLSAMIDQNP